MAKMRNSSRFGVWAMLLLLVPRDDLEDGDNVEISQSISDQNPSLHSVAPSARSLYPACLMLPSSWLWVSPSVDLPPVSTSEDKMLFTLHPKWLWFCELLRSQHVPGSHVNGMGIKTKQSKPAFDNKWVDWKWVVSAEGCVCFLLVYCLPIFRGKSLNCALPLLCQV